MSPKVSVVLTSYNHAPFIGEAIESVLAQTLADFELIIIDDVSTDNSWEIIQSYTDPRIRAIRADRNYCAKNFYAAVHSARGEYVAIHHSDDLWMPEKLEKQVGYLDAHPACAAVFTHVQGLDAQGNPAESDLIAKFRQPNRTRHQWLRFFFYNLNALCHPSVMLRQKTAFEMYTNYSPTLLPDWEKWIRICCRDDIHVLQEALTIFRLHDKNRSQGGPCTRNLVRLDLETTHTLRLFRNIGPAEEWLKVFPEMRAYMVNGELEPEYALARLCLEPGRVVPSGYALFGLQLLFELLDNEETRLRVERLYDFRAPELETLCGSRDLFNLRTPRPHEPLGVLALDFGQGYDWRNPLVVPCTPDMNDAYTATFDLRPAMQANPRLPLRGLSFVPAHGQLCRHSLESCVMDGFSLALQAVNAAETAEGWDVFHTTTPLYQGTAERPRGVELIVKGAIQFLKMDETFAVCARLEQENMRLRQNARTAPQPPQQPPVGRCSLCGNPVSAWVPLSKDFLAMYERHGFDVQAAQPEFLDIQRFMCPHCNGMDRERLAGEFLLRRLGKGFADPAFRLLEFAPRDAMGDFIRRNFTLRRETADLFMDGVDYKLDCSAMPEIPENSVDAWISLHVLEHVPDDRAALREMLRILKPGGFGVLLVPLSLALEETDEDPTAPVAERWRRFGQDDHVRMYAKKDVTRKIEEAGFTLHQYGKEWFGEECFERLGLPDTAVLYVLEKPCAPEGRP